ncbi:MAG TPA: hypothetical protein IAA53_05650, partial [Candidatus Avoscillospira avicola]|nr:hypothetical protein [Candidatus Avoscillospira avicola]
MAGKIPVFLSGSFLNKRRFNRKRRRRELLFQTAQSEQKIRRLPPSIGSAFTGGGKHMKSQNLTQGSILKSLGSTAQFGKSIRPKILPHTKVIKGREY